MPYTGTSSVGSSRKFALHSYAFSLKRAGVRVMVMVRVVGRVIGRYMIGARARVDIRARVQLVGAG